MSIETIINRQYDIANNQADDIQLPKQKIYATCNLRGGIGKTTLSFNLIYHFFMIPIIILDSRQM